MFEAILTWSYAQTLVKVCIETLTSAESSHLTDIFHAHLCVALICEQRHCIVHTIIINQLRIILVESSCTHCRNITRVRAQVLSQLFRVVLRILVFSLRYNQTDNLITEAVFSLLTQQGLISC